MYKYEGIFKPYNPEAETTSKQEETPIYERPGRLDPERNIPITRQDRVDVNVHYDEQEKTFVKASPDPEFTGISANAMNPFEDTALLKGDVKPKSTGIKTGASLFESKIFKPETDTEEVRAKVKETIDEPVIEHVDPVYIAEEDVAASSDDIASAMSGVETVAEPQIHKSGFAIVDVSRLKMYVYLVGIFIVLEVLGIALLLFL